MVWGMTRALVLGALFIAACKSSEGQAPSPAPVVGPMAAVELSSAYKNDAAAADSRFKGKRFTVTGKIIDSGPDLRGTAYVNLVDRSSGVTCYFKKEKTPNLDALKPGDDFTMEGKCAGAALGIVVMQDCATP